MGWNWTVSAGELQGSFIQKMPLPSKDLKQPIIQTVSLILLLEMFHLAIIRCLTANMTALTL